jgi:hypothetical protein
VIIFTSAGSPVTPPVLWGTKDLPGEFLAPAAAELVFGLATEAAELVLQLAREAAQLVLRLVADLAENSFLSFCHLVLLLLVSKLTRFENRPRGPKSMELASARQRTPFRKWLILR